MADSGFDRLYKGLLIALLFRRFSFLARNAIRLKVSVLILKREMRRNHSSQKFARDTNHQVQWNLDPGSFVMIARRRT